MCAHSHHDESSGEEEHPLRASEEGILPAAQREEPEPRGLGARIGVGLVRGYQRYISAYTPPVCRFYPTCSQYTLTAIKRYGLLKGCWLGMWRILRCHPFHPGGIDHVP